MLKLFPPFVLVLILLLMPASIVYADCDDLSCAIDWDYGEGTMRNGNAESLCDCRRKVLWPPPISKNDIRRVKTDRSSLEYDEKGTQIILAGNFQEEVEYFYSYYGRVPSSYEEWLASGFLLFTPWSGYPATPAIHVDRSPSAEEDPYGTFHYEAVSPSECKLEFVFDIGVERKVLSFEKRLAFKGNRDEFKDEPGRSVEILPELNYIEAKADAYYALLELLHINYAECSDMSMRMEHPDSLLDLADGYVSLVPEAFRMPEGIDASGSFELGIDWSNGRCFIISNLPHSRFSKLISPMHFRTDQEARAGAISDDSIVLFSSELLKAGYPGLFE